MREVFEYCVRIVMWLAMLFFLASGCPWPWAWVLIGVNIFAALFLIKRTMDDLLKLSGIPSVIWTILFTVAWGTGWPPGLVQVLFWSTLILTPISMIWQIATLKR